MPTAAQVLAKFAADLKFEDIPPAVVDRAKDCIIDTLAAGRFGAQLPWSRMVDDYARRYGNGGRCSIIGSETRVLAPYAALANGVHIHAFEQDSGRQPAVGAHVGATIVPSLLATCEECGADGRTAVTAFVAACEVMSRIAVASHHIPEDIGFHAPGLTGPFGAAIAAGKVRGYSGEQLEHALGIAGSLSSGLLAFTKSKQGGMVKRLHLGRASESGMLAAGLAGAGYTGPETVLEGKCGFLEVYCGGGEPAMLTKNLNREWETLLIGMKPYPMHGNTQTSVQSLSDLMSKHGFKAADVERITVEGSKRLLSHHNIREPGDIMQAQYSVPFCVALALLRDPADPNSLMNGALDDPQIRDWCRHIDLRAPEGLSGKTARVTVRLKDGCELSRTTDKIRGWPDNPMSRDELRRKFMYTRNAPGNAEQTLQHLEQLEKEPLFSLN